MHAGRSRACCRRWCGYSLSQDVFEKFECLEGELGVQLGKEIHRLKPNQYATAHPNINHRFFNDTPHPCRFKVELQPASAGFEKSLQIGYGLARDGQTNAKGFPKNRLALAWLLEISESNLPGWMSIFEFILRSQARKAKKVGLDQELVKKYVRF